MLKAFDIDVDVVASSERKKAAQRFQLNNHVGLRHVFQDCQDHAHGGGLCARHKKECFLSAEDLKVDFVVGGLSCHPLSKVRQRSGSTKRTGTAEDHPDFEVIFEIFPDYLDRRQPGGFLCEEVLGILEKMPGKPDRYIDEFIKVCSSRAGGYAVRALVLDQKDWVDWPRARSVGASAYCWRKSKVLNMILVSLTHTRGLGSGFLTSSSGVLVCLALLFWALGAILLFCFVLWVGVGVLVCLVSVWIYALRNVIKTFV
jgi:hypothetical protein